MGHARMSTPSSARRRSPSPSPPPSRGPSPPFHPWAWLWGNETIANVTVVLREPENSTTSVRPTSSENEISAASAEDEQPLKQPRRCHCAQRPLPGALPSSISGEGQPADDQTSASSSTHALTNNTGLQVQLQATRCSHYLRIQLLPSNHCREWHLPNGRQGLVS